MSSSRSAPESREELLRARASLKALAAEVGGQRPSRIPDGYVYLLRAEIVDAALADLLTFSCPACGVSFKVASERSERIYCGSRCRGLTSGDSGALPNPSAACPPPEEGLNG